MPAPGAGGPNFSGEQLDVDVANIARLNITGTQTLTGTVTATGNRYDVITRDQGRRIAKGYIAETFDIAAGDSTGSILLNQQVQYALVYLYQGEVVTNLYAHTTVAGSGQTSVWMALFNSALSQVAITADVKTVFAATAGLMVCPLTAAYVVLADGAYYIAILGIGGTQPTLMRSRNTNATAGDPIGTGLRPFGQQTGQATMPTTAVIAQSAVFDYFRAG